MSITNSERTRICLRYLIDEDLKAFRKNIFEVENSPLYYQNCLVELYVGALSYKQNENFVFDFANAGKTKKDAYLDFFNENQLRTVSLAFYYFNYDYKQNDDYYKLTKGDVSALMQKAVKKAKAKINNFNNYKSDIKPIIKIFNSSLRMNGLKLTGEVLRPNSSTELQEEYNQALKNYRLAFNDFKFLLRDYESTSVAYILQNLNKGFYASEFGKLYAVEPFTSIRDNKAQCLSAKFLRMHTYKFNKFIEQYKEFEQPDTSVKSVGEFAEYIGSSARETIKEIQGKYPELTKDFTDMYFANTLNEGIKIIEEDCYEM